MQHLRFITIFFFALTVLPVPVFSREILLDDFAGGPSYGWWEKSFGKYPDRIGAIAIMTDTDNTGESATAFYGPIRILTDAGKK